MAPLEVVSDAQQAEDKGVANESGVGPWCFVPKGGRQEASERGGATELGTQLVGQTDSGGLGLGEVYRLEATSEKAGDCPYDRGDNEDGLGVAAPG